MKTADMAREYLYKAYDAVMDVRLIEAELAEYRSVAYGVRGHSGDESGVRSTDMHSPTESTAVKMAALEERLEQKRAEALETISEAELMIAQVPCQRHRDMLCRRYLMCQPWEKVRKQMGYDNNNAMFKAHRRALYSLYQYL